MGKIRSFKLHVFSSNLNALVRFFNLKVKCIFDKNVIWVQFPKESKKNKNSLFLSKTNVIKGKSCYR